MAEGWSPDANLQAWLASNRNLTQLRSEVVTELKGYDALLVTPEATRAPFGLCPAAMGCRLAYRGCATGVG